jgi:predicted ATPase/DNA-binding SARP family transcriptional activator
MTASPEALAGTGAEPRTSRTSPARLPRSATDHADRPPRACDPARAARYAQTSCVLRPWEGSPIRASILGPLEVSVDGRDITPTAAKQRALLICLLLDRGRAVSADRLVEAVWGTHAPASARNLLTVYVSQLRRAIGADTIETRAGGYAAAIDPDDLDAHRFERLAAEGTTARATGNPGLAVSRLTRALELWRGPALADVAGAAFAEPDARRLEELRLTSREERLAAELDLGRHETVAGEARALALSEPYRERPRHLLMLALYRGDRQAEALNAYREFRAMLRDELGLEPSAVLRDLHRAVLTRDVEPVVATLRDVRSELPAPMTSLIGRRQELADLAELLQRPGMRLVNVTGTGGSGKSRIAVAIAERTRERFANGVAFVELAPLEDPRLVTGAIAQQLGVAERGDEELLRTLSRWLAPRELLLILDNLERLVDAGPALVQLLRAAPMLTILATSRRILNLSGEHVFPLQPLPIDDAVRLFATRALARDPGLDPQTLEAEPGREICQRLDCLPLAVELAATQVGTLGVEHLRERLRERVVLLADGPRDVPARQRTLHDTLAWSTDLLSPEERAQFARLAVASGGCSEHAALAISGGTAGSLASLAADSLLRVSDEGGETRYSMLETIRDHALALLARSAAPDEARAAHAAYFAELIGRIAPRGEQSSARLRLIDHDIDNFRAAMDWLEHTRDDGAALQLATGLYHYWYLRGLLREGRSRLGVPLDRGAGSPALRALALRALAGLDLVFGDIESAEARAQEGIATGTGARALEPVMGCETVLGLAALGRGRLDEARTHIARSGALARDLGLEADVVIADTNLAEIAFRARDLDDARHRFEGIVTWHEQSSAPEGGVFALLGLASIAYAEDRLDEADQLFTRTRRLAGTAGFTQLAGHAHIGLAAVAARRGNHAEAAGLLGRADGLFDEVAGPSAEFDPALAASAEASARASLGERGYAIAYAAGRQPHAGLSRD